MFFLKFFDFFLVGLVGFLSAHQQSQRGIDQLKNRDPKQGQDDDLFGGGELFHFCFPLSFLSDYSISHDLQFVKCFFAQIQKNFLSILTMLFKILFALMITFSGYSNIYAFFHFFKNIRIYSIFMQIFAGNKL